MEVKPEPKKEELKTTLDTKSENQSVFSTKAKNQMLKNAKFANSSEHQNWKTVKPKKSSGTKTTKKI